MESSFAYNLKTLRGAAGFTQSEFAERLDVHLQTVSKWERGVSEPDISLYGEIAEILGVSIEELFGQPRPDKTHGGTFDAERLGKALSELRRSLHEDQKDIAAVTDSSVDAVSKWERAVICPSIPKLIILAEHFGVSLSALYYGDAAGGGAGRTAAQEKHTSKEHRPRGLYVLLYGVLLAAAIVTVILVSVRSCRSASSLPSAPQNVRVNDGIVLWDSVDGAGAYDVRINNTYTERVHNVLMHDLSLSLSGPGDVEISVRAVLHSGSGYSAWSDSISYTYTKPHEHSWGAPVTVTPVGEHSDGAAKKSCTVCGKDETFVLPATSHSFTVERIQPPTCTADGYTLHSCYCGASYSTDIVPAFGHTTETTAAIPATCTAHGLTEGKRCSVCRTVLELSEQTPALGHSFSGLTCTRCDMTVTPTADTYFDFSLNSHGTYSVSPKDIENIPAEIVIPTEHDGIPVTYIDGFEGCRKLASLVFFPNITAMSFACFRDCTALESVYFMGTLTQWLNVDMQQYCFFIKHDLYINGELVSDIVIPDGITSIKAHAFNDCRNIRSIRLSDTVTSIGEGAFGGCDGLKELYIPYSVVTISGHVMPGVDLVIYCEAPRQPAGWDKDWNDAECRVVWGYSAV